jgi:HEPN domain-containing protein
MRAIEQAQLLQRKAAQDLAVLQKLINDPTINTETLGFHAQQAAEKLIKALLALGGHDYPHTHDLGLLLDLLAAVDVRIPEALLTIEAIVEEAAPSWHPANCKGSPTTVAKSETVQSRSWLNL